MLSYSYHALHIAASLILQDTSGVAKFNFAYSPRKVSQCILQLFMLWPCISMSALAGKYPVWILVWNKCQITWYASR